jgi:DNA-binding NarL/FixJ family response regulator
MTNPPWQVPLLATGPPTASVTARQADVLTGICMGLTNRQIGARLLVAEATVKRHVRGLLRALTARDRAHAAALAASGQVTVHVRESSSWRAA